MSVNEREEAIMQEEKMHRSTYRVLKIFELLSATSEGMSLTGLAQKLEIPKGSLHPILKTMQAMNFIRMNDNGNYTIGQAKIFCGFFIYEEFRSVTGNRLCFEEFVICG